MSSLNKYLLFAKFTTLLCLVSADTYSVKIATDRYVNVVDRRFLSFTVDPKYLFSSSEKYSSKESVCMASALTPAYIRIAGPSTTHMTFHNATITFTDLDLYEGHSDLEELAVTNGQWKKFVKWAKLTGFDLVFALNNEEKTESGLWDPNSALNILTMAEKADVGDMYWQLGFECKNQTIEDYLNDLETLRVIMETFTGAHEWRALGGDVTPCLTPDSKSDFKDYVMLSDDMDALMLNGNSSAQQLERMSDSDRLKLLHYLSTSTTPLWLTETPNPQVFSELLRAADWMTSLGYSAMNGFAVHFREMIEDELYEPTLSFYMALLFKNLVGERVLDVDIEASQAVLFAHCTSLRHKPVPGAVTLFGANMDDEPARFSVKMSRREEGGDIMQFILGHDRTGNIVVNGKAMYYEGDIRPVVKRVRPYKTLLLNLPPKSFGFWVVANTKIEACHDTNNSTELVKALPITDDDTVASNSIKTKRSMGNTSDDDIDSSEVVFDSNETEENDGLKKRIDDLNAELDNVHTIFETTGKFKQRKQSRSKRQIFDTENESGIGKLKRFGLKHRHDKNRLFDEPKNKLVNLRKLLGLNGRFNHTRLLSHHERSRKGSKFGKQVNKRHSHIYKVKPVEKKILEKENNTIVEDKVSRRRRAILTENHNISSKGKEHEEIGKLGNHEKLKKDQDHKEKRNIKHLKQKRKNYNHEETSTENEIDVDSADQAKLWKILRQIHEQLKDLHTEENVEYVDTGEDSKDVIVKRKLSDDAASINVSEKTEGLLKSTIGNVLDVLAELNKKLDKVWNVLSILD